MATETPKEWDYPAVPMVQAKDLDPMMMIYTLGAIRVVYASGPHEKGFIKIHFNPFDDKENIVVGEDHSFQHVGWANGHLVRYKGEQIQ